MLLAQLQRTFAPFKSVSEPLVESSLLWGGHHLLWLWTQQTVLWCFLLPSFVVGASEFLCPIRPGPIQRPTEGLQETTREQDPVAIPWPLAFGNGLPLKPRACSQSSRPLPWWTFPPWLEGSGFQYHGGGEAPPCSPSPLQQLLAAPRASCVLSPVPFCSWHTGLSLWERRCPPPGSAEGYQRKACRCGLCDVKAFQTRQAEACLVWKWPTGELGLCCMGGLRAWSWPGLLVQFDSALPPGTSRTSAVPSSRYGRSAGWTTSLQTPSSRRTGVLSRAPSGKAGLTALAIPGREGRQLPAPTAHSVSGL